MIPSPPRGFRVSVDVDGVARVMHVHEWGDRLATHAVICVHGLTRNGRDFDVLASRLAVSSRVLCPDVPGRGQSDWLARVEHYSIPTYLRFMQALLLESGIRRADWVGTSMGGLIGMALAATPEQPIRRLVLNDVGPAIERRGLERIASYVGSVASFVSFEALLAAVAPALDPFGPLTDEQRRHLVETSWERRADGRWHSKTDPKIGAAFLASLDMPPVDLWPLWERCASAVESILILRGEYSDLLSPETVETMLATAPNARAIIVPQTGHAPMLMDAQTISVVEAFLLAPSRARGDEAF
ncbi:MAG: alpha/beta hydrolase [Casimicrobiaceae bacterium]|nr:alpha/beta hydrolase [Casimicrobiaceae bacterium]